ncbi:MAG: hypothetical protein KDC44_23615, partial [Phaeodactylibacter sp.]|nr:hypothetical protein [Phaeodactylibacter sp.]
LQSSKKTLHVRIMPPFYKRLWFRSLIVLVGLTLIFLVINAIIQRNRRKQRHLLEKQQAREEERSRIAQELHDSMGTGISVIQFLTARVRNPEDVEKVAGLFAKVNRKSHDLLQEMQDIVWALKPENDRLSMLIQQMQGFLEEYLELANLPYRFRCGADLLDIELSGERRLNTFLIFKESIHNIVRHAAASRIEIWLDIQDDRLQLQIRDDGKGMDLPEKRKGGRSGLAGLYKRADKLNGQLVIDTAPGKGTQIELRYSVK